MRLSLRIGLVLVCALFALRCSSFGSNNAEGPASDGDGGADVAQSDAAFVPRVVLSGPPILVGRPSQTITLTIDMAREGLVGEGRISVSVPNPAQLSSPAEVVLPNDQTRATFDVTIAAGAKPTTDDLLIEVTGNAGGVTASLDVPFAIWGRPGTPDQSFGDAGFVVGPEGDGVAVAVQKTGHVIVAGTTADPKHFLVARFTRRGALDTTFGASGQKVIDFEPTDELVRVFVRPDDRILVVGYTPTKTAVAQLTTGGALDPAFGTQGKVLTAFGRPLAKTYGARLAADGKLVVVGEANALPNTDSLIGRLNVDGSPDDSVDTSGAKVHGIDPNNRDIFSDVEVEVGNEKRIVAAGHAEDLGQKSVLAGFTSNAIGDASFKLSTGTAETFSLIARQPDGRLLTVSNHDVRRWTADGQEDTTFNGLNGKIPIVAHSVSALVIEANGSIVLFSDSAMQGVLSRFGPDGTPAMGFGGAPDQHTYSFDVFGQKEVIPMGMALQPDGKIIVTGTTVSPANRRTMFVGRFYP